MLSTLKSNPSRALFSRLFSQRSFKSTKLSAQEYNSMMKVIKVPQKIKQLSFILYGPMLLGTIALWILKKTDAGFGITQELTRALLSMVSLTISVESGMNVGFAYYRYLYAPSAFAKHILSQALYGISVPALLLSLSGLLLTVKDGVPLNWNFMILLFANLLFTIVDRSISALGLAPHWFVRYRVTTCFLSYLVIVNVALVYMRKLRGWDRKKMLMNDVKEETENEDLSEIAEEVYKNTGLRTDIKTKVPTNQK